MSVNIQLGTSRRVPRATAAVLVPHKSFFFSSSEGLLRVHAHSHHRCLSVSQLHMLKLEGCLLYSSSGTVWGSFVLFKGIYLQLLLLLREGKSFSTFPAQKPLSCSTEAEQLLFSHRFASLTRFCIELSLLFLVQSLNAFSQADMNGYLKCST